MKRDRTGVFKTHLFIRRCRKLQNTQNLVTPRNGELIIAATQDFLTGAYLMTLKDTFFTEAEFKRLACSLIASVDKDLDIDIPPPCILKVRTEVISFLVGRMYLR